MIKLTKLQFDLKESSQQFLDDVSAEYQEAVEHADRSGLPKPSLPKPIKLLNKHYDIFESIYYVEARSIKELWNDSENVTILMVDGKEVYVKETVEEVYEYLYPKPRCNEY